MNTQNSKKQKLGDDIINMYKDYRNTQTKWKRHKLGMQIFQLPDYYKPVSLIGSGAYGAVIAAFDFRLPQNKRQQHMVAIKKMTNAFEHKIFARRILRQLKLLRLLKHPNIISVQTIILPRSRQDFEDIYVVFQLMDSDMFSLIKKGEEQLSQSHYQYFVYQILRSLMYIHSANVIHRDIKTRNLLINADCNIKICDFGLARLMVKSKKQGAQMTDYVATRWYRAPELLLGETNYTPAVDIWSVGCILAELIIKKAFLPAKTTQQQLELICEMIETSQLQAMKQKNPSHYEIISKIQHRLRKRRSNLVDEKMKNIPQRAKDLLKKMLAFDPDMRITAKEALNHPYLTQFREKDQEIIRDPINMLQFEFDNYKMTTQQLKDVIYEQILLYHFPTFEKSYKSKILTNTSVISHILKNSNLFNIIPSADNDNDQDDEE